MTPLPGTEGWGRYSHVKEQFLSWNFLSKEGTCYVNRQGPYNEGFQPWEILEGFPEMVAPQLKSDGKTEANTGNLLSLSQMVVFELGLETQCPNTALAYPKPICPRSEVAGDGGQ